LCDSGSNVPIEQFVAARAPTEIVLSYIDDSISMKIENRIPLFDLRASFLRPPARFQIPRLKSLLNYTRNIILQKREMMGPDSPLQSSGAELPEIETASAVLFEHELQKFLSGFRFEKLTDLSELSMKAGIMALVDLCMDEVSIDMTKLQSCISYVFSDSRAVSSEASIDNLVSQVLRRYDDL
jgi:hypothetical protein